MLTLVHFHHFHHFQLQNSTFAIILHFICENRFGYAYLTISSHMLHIIQKKMFRRAIMLTLVHFCHFQQQTSAFAIILHFICEKILIYGFGYAYLTISSHMLHIIKAKKFRKAVMLIRHSNNALQGLPTITMKVGREVAKEVLIIH